MKILILLFSVLSTLPAFSATFEPGDSHKETIRAAVSFIVEVLGEENPAAETLLEIQNDNDFYLDLHLEGSGYATRWLGVDEEIIFNARLVYNSRSRDIMNDSYSWFMKTVLHEGVHMGYDVFDPRAGRITHELLKAFYPKQFGRVQPARVLNNLNCRDLRSYYDRISYLRLREFKYTMKHTSFHILSGPTANDDINSYFSAYVDRLLRIDRANYSTSRRYERLEEVNRQWRADVETLNERWGVRLPVLDFVTLLPFKWENRTELTKEEIAQYFSDQMPANPIRCP